jgi:hypothetical protein
VGGGEGCVIDPALSTENFSSLLQGIAAVLGLVFTPSLLYSAISSRIPKVKVLAVGVVEGSDDATPFWMLEITPNRRIVRNLEVHCYPRRQGNRVKSYKLSSPNDGGLCVSASVHNAGWLSIIIEKAYKKRLIKIRISLNEADFINVDADGGKVNLNQKLTRFMDLQLRSRMASLSHTRIMTLIVTCVAIYIPLVASIIWLGFLYD